ncbi:MAG: PASTA domain-containing protein [Ruminococcus sp.]|nr:PASTA domain-containing protein [Ruminococcus sp.]
MFHTRHTLKSIICLALAVMCIASVALLAGCGSKITVPDLVGMTKEEAESTVADSGLTLNVQRERYSKKNPEGTIDAMITKVGETVEKGSEVRVVGSLGEGVEVPNIGILTGKEGANLVAKVGLNPIVVEEYSDQVEEGNIISYTDGGQTIPKGADVTITVSKGPEN